jgi:hypothetical protein
VPRSHLGRLIVRREGRAHPPRLHRRDR